MKRLLTAALAGLLLLATGCTSHPSDDEQPSPTAVPSSGPSVHTDWSALTPYEPFRTVGSRQSQEFMDTLSPRPDYGPLVPYVGSTASYTLSWDETASSYDYDFYGLATLDGKQVTDPVFDSVFLISSYRDDVGLVSYTPFWKLVKTVETEEGPQQRCAVAALDGSWCTGFSYLYNFESSGLNACESGFLLADLDRECISVFSAQGEEIFRLDRQESPDASQDWWAYPLLDQLSLGEGFLRRQYRDSDTYQPSRAEFYDLSTGKLLDTPELIQAFPFSCGRALAQDAATGLWGYLAADGSWAIPPTYSYAEGGGFYLDRAVVYQDGQCLLIDVNGSTVAELGSQGNSIIREENGSIYVSGKLWVDPAGKVYPLEGGHDYQWSGSYPSYSTDTELVVLTAEGESRFPYPGQLSFLSDRLVLICQSAPEEDKLTYLLVDRSSGEVLLSIDSVNGYIIPLQDNLSPDSEPYYAVTDGQGFRIYSPEGRFFFTSDSWPQSVHGLIQVSDALSTGLLNQDGEWVLRLSRFGSADD